MKKLLMTLLLSTLVSTVFAQDGGLDQQISLTRDAIAQLTSDLQVRDSAGGLNIHDYRTWLEDFKKNMEENFKSYEKNVGIKVFGPVKEVISRMNTIAEDQNLKPEIKHAQLDSLKGQLESMKPTLQKEYHNLLKKLYNSNNVFPTQIKLVKERYFKRSGKEVKKQSRSDYEIKSFSLGYTDNLFDPGVINVRTNSGGRDLKFSYSSSHAHFNYNGDLMSNSIEKSCWSNDCAKIPGTRTAFYQTLLDAPYNDALSRIVKGCETKACIILKASEIAFWYQSIKSLLDKDISVSLPIIKEHFDQYRDVENVQFIIPALGFGLENIQEVLKRNDFTPEIENLPYDI